MGLGSWRLGTWIGWSVHMLILIGDAQGTSTVYARRGETATLSWDLPTPGLQTFTVNITFVIHERVYKNREIFRVTNYNTVTMMSNIPNWKMQFVGNITPSGTGVFSFMLHDVTWSDAGHYRCFIPSSHTAAAEVPGCGQRLVVYDFQQLYIAAPVTAHVDRSVTLTCYSHTMIYSDHDVNTSVEWRRNGLMLDKSPTWNNALTILRRSVMQRGYTNKRTVSDTAKGDNFQCQFVFGRRAVSGWSDVYALVEQRNSAHPNISVIVNITNIVLTCKANSSIIPVDHDLRIIYTWQRNGQRVENGGRFHASGQTLALLDVKREDLGNFSCQSTVGGLASNWSDTVDLQILARPEVRELTVNGAAHTAVKENQVVVFRCMVEDYLSPAVSLIQENSLTSVNMSRKQHNVYEHVMVVRKCSQLGVYSCRATNVAGSSEDEHRTVVLKGVPHELASHAFVTIGETPSLAIHITLCSYPGPSETKWRFTQSGRLREITDMKKYRPATETIKHNVFEYSLAINNITDADFGVYIFSVECNHSSADFIIPASRITDTPESNLPLVAGSSVAAVIVALGIIAGLILSRLNQLRDYWNLRFRSYITPMQNMPENIDEREYAEIDDADLSGRGAGNIVQVVLDDNNIPPLCGARHRRERQQLEGEDGDYEEVRPLGAANREEERTADMPQPDKEILEDITDEMFMISAGSHSHPERPTDGADWSAEGRESGNMAAAIINQFAETSFMTQEPDETDTAKVPTASAMYSGIDGMTAVETDADKPLVEGREDFVESELDLPCNRYESLMLPQKQDPYTVLDNNDVITHA